MASGGHAKLAGGAFAVQELAQHSALNQGQTGRWGAFTIER